MTKPCKRHALALCLFSMAPTAYAQAPLHLDASIAVRVEPDRRLVPGEAGRMVVRWANAGPDNAVSLIGATSYFESFHARESIRFVGLGTADECDYFLDYPGFPNPEDVHYFGQVVIRLGPVPAGGSGECLLGFRVGADPEPFPPLEFTIGDGQRLMEDPVPGDNVARVQLRFHEAGQRVQAIPAAGRSGVYCRPLHPSGIP